MKKWKWILERLADYLLITFFAAIGAVIGMFIWGWIL